MLTQRSPSPGIVSTFGLRGCSGAGAASWPARRGARSLGFGRFGIVLSLVSLVYPSTLDYATRARRACNRPAAARARLVYCART